MTVTLPIKPRLSVPLVSFEYFKLFRSHLIKQATWYSILKLGEKLTGRQEHPPQSALPENNCHGRIVTSCVCLLMDNHPAWLCQHTQLRADTASSSSASSYQHGREPETVRKRHLIGHRRELTQLIRGDVQRGRRQFVTNKGFSFRWGKISSSYGNSASISLLSPPMHYGKKGNRYVSLLLNVCVWCSTLNPPMQRSAGERTWSAPHTHIHTHIASGMDFKFSTNRGEGHLSCKFLTNSIML